MNTHIELALCNSFIGLKTCLSRYHFSESNQPVTIDESGNVVFIFFLGIIIYSTTLSDYEQPVQTMIDTSIILCDNDSANSDVRSIIHLYIIIINYQTFDNIDLLLYAMVCFIISWLKHFLR